MALFLNYVAMAELSLSVIRVSWLRFIQSQLPALRLTIVVTLATVAAAAGFRHFEWPPMVGLTVGLLAATGTAILTMWLAPMFALGQYGIGMRNLLWSYVQPRLPRLRLRGPA
jgi:hypothetical protein